VAILIKLDSSGPVFFMQTRAGFNSRPFRIFKFRTLHTLEDGSIVRQVSRNDPRLTRVGRVLRKTSIDELPQLFNVLRGEMSLVGPRPHAAAHNTVYEQVVANYAFRHHVRPGLTGWAQVNGLRGETTVETMQRRVDLDLWYIDNWSLWLDIKIIVRTIALLLQQPSAY
jgi:undecaprenyl-phosphate galactose phosphotransferase/putative colanic acid biosynthesis UDP-glucose lipid carrier transferase